MLGLSVSRFPAVESRRRILVAIAPFILAHFNVWPPASMRSAPPEFAVAR